MGDRSIDCKIGLIASEWQSSHQWDHSAADEAIVRGALRKELLADESRGTQIVEEFWVPQSYERADIGVLGWDITGYEIKTERDTLLRLPRQMGAYGRIFDRCTAVVAPRHQAATIHLLPRW